MSSSSAIHDIIVVGASAGGFEAFKRLVADLPSDLPASLFIVWHMSPSAQGILPQVLNRLGPLAAAYAFDNELIERGRIYIAPPDHHLLVERDRVRVTRGPKENGFRPAVDPLFRSAAYAYGPRVMGAVLSGGLDDGTAGLWTVKNRGGVAIIQDPREAEVPGMPENALRAVKVDHVVPICEMGSLLARLCREPVEEKAAQFATGEDEKLELEIRIAAEDNSFEDNIMRFGEPTHFTCPECHGVLSVLRDGHLTRFRCHTGHAYSADTLLAALTERIEDSLWNAVRGVEESVLLLNHMGDHFAEANFPKVAALYFQKANEAGARARAVRKIVAEHEQLSQEGLVEQAQEQNGQGRDDSQGRDDNHARDGEAQEQDSGAQKREAGATPFPA